MFRFDLPFTEAQLLLTPRLSGLSRYTQIGVLALILGVCLLLILRLYRHELRLIPRRTAVFLLLLRCTLVASLFLVVSLKPTLARTITETIPSKVLIGVDRSDSMSVTDAQRSLAEKFDLARGLKLAKDIVDDSTLARWAEDARRGSVTPNDKDKFDRVVQRIDALTRHQITTQVLAPDGTNILEAIGKKHTLDVTLFTQEGGDLPKEWTPLQKALSDLDAKLAGNAFTDVKKPLVRAIERGGSGEGKLLGVVILSDGQHNWGVSPLNKARELGQRGVPVYFVGIGAKDPPPDLSMLSVKATPATVFKNAYTNVEARVLVNNLPAGKVKVTLNYPDSRNGKNRDPLIEEITHDGSNGPRLVTFTARMDQPGTETLTVTAEHLPTDKNDPRKDTRPENNSRPVVVTVSPDKAKVLLVDGEIRWEFHYLHTALIRDETMDTTSVVFEQPRLNAVNDDNLKKMGFPDLALPKDLETLMGYDCIILGDVGPEQLGKAEREVLEKYVSERGGTLVLLAGKRSMPMDFLKEGDPFLKLLPISTPRVHKEDTGFRVTLTPEGLQTGFLRMEANAGLSAETWSNLPPHYWAIVGKAKDGAVPLAYVPTGEARDAAAARDMERNNALIVRQNFGFGKVVFVGVDSTWRWRFKKGDTYNHRFWSQMIRWAASDRALIAGNEFVRFGAREPVYRADQDVEVVARFSEKVKKLGPDSLAGVRLLRKSKPGAAEENIGLMPLRPHPVIPRERNGQQQNLPPGDYDLELVIPDIEDKLNGPDGKKLRAKFQVLPADTGEMLDLSTNWLLMEDIAAKSGGKVFPAENAAELIDLLQSRSATREYAIEQKVWQSWWTLLLFVALLTLEWVVRKFAGLP